MKTPWLLASALLFVSLPGLTQMTPKGPVAGQEKARCTAVATCESGTVQCTSTRSSTSCSAVDFDCSGVRGSVTCDGRTIQCPRLGEVCHIEQRPAATLLLPYFEVAEEIPAIPGVPGSGRKGWTTLISVSNAYEDPVLVHAQVWTDLGVYVFGFFFYLKGNSVQSITLSEVLLEGKLLLREPIPSTFSHCASVQPSQELSADFLESLQAALRGQPARLFSNQCVGFDHGDDVLRGYMTFQVVNDCTVSPPGPGYFLPGGTGIATNQNVLKGDYFYLDFPVETPSGSPNRVKAGLPMVHIRASCTDPATSLPGRYTFHGASTSWNAADNRQPLPTGFQVRFFNDPPVLGTDLIVWRDPKAVQGGFQCGATPPLLRAPMGQEVLRAFDEAGNSVALSSNGHPFDLVAQRVHIGSTELSVSARYGWLALGLNRGVAATNPPFDPAAQQAWVTVLYNNETTGVLMDAAWLDTACEALHQP